jgi:hypothetical protein
MAKTATKTTKKVSTAKGKGKVVKKTTKPVTKKAVAKKPAVKKVKVVKDPYAWLEPNKANPTRHIRYSNVSIAEAFTDKFPEMVEVTKAPARYTGLIGKRYLNWQFAVKAINEYQAESLISKGAKHVAKELDEVGILAVEAGDIED